MTMTNATNIDEYIAGFSKDTQEILEQIRATIKKAAPDAKETIKYAMPTFTLQGNIVHFAAYKNHIGLYPVPTGINVLEKDLFSYKMSGKGSIRFPLDKPMPLDLITKIVKFNVKRNLDKAAKK